MSQDSENRTGISLGTKKVYGGLILSLFVFAIAATLSVAFVYESQTLWYKAGIDKSILRTGQMAGLLALLFIFIQVLMGVRVKLLEEIFGVALVMRGHRANGLIIGSLAIAHVGLVLVTEGITNLPIGWKFWPEMVGAVLLLLIVGITVSSQFRQQFGFSYTRWRFVHRILGYLALALVSVHVLFVSDSFTRDVPKTALLVVLAVVVGWVVQTKRAAMRK